MTAALARDLVITYGARRAVDGLDLTVSAASVTALLGPNGAGKSSTLAALAGLVQPSSGTVRVLDAAPGERSARDRVGVMLQDDGLPSGAHGPEIVRHVAALRRNPESAEPLIKALQLGALGRTTIRRLSGGERRRVSLACALVGSPDLVLLDEPTSGLDHEGRGVVADLVDRLRGQGVAVLLSTHLLDEAERLADHVTIIAGGRAVATGSVASLTADSEERIDFTARAHLDVEALARALPDNCRVEESSPGEYRVWGSADPHTLATVSAWCAQHAAMPTRINAGRETLADAYQRLTGGAPG
jgi:ABC-2 type transport system ATP-binding protein